MSIRMGSKLYTKLAGTRLIKKLNDRVYRKMIDGTFGTAKMPKPTFFSDAEIERMSHTPGSYQYKGGEACDA